MKNKQILNKYFSKSVVFSGLEKKELEKIVSLIQEKKCEKGKKIIVESVHGKDIFVVISGRIVVYLKEKNKKKIVDYLFPGDLLGEIGFFTGRRSATCECLEPTIVGVIKYKDFYNLISKNAHIALNIIKILTKRLLSADHEIKNLAFRSALQRVVDTILDTSCRGKNLYISVTELAENVGVNRETVSRIISLLEKLEYIYRDENNKLKVLNRNKLETLLEK